MLSELTKSVAFDDANNFVLPAIHTLLSGDDQSLDIQHLSVAMGHGDHDEEDMDDMHMKKMKDHDDSDESDDDDHHKGKKGHGKKGWKGKGKGKKLHCKGDDDMSAECINTFFSELAENNEWEWVMAMK